VEARYHDDGDLAYEEAVRAGFDPTSFCPPRLAVPWNVYFTGTVNVDETTYTFSPKVLDRAHVLEFQQVDLDGYFAQADGSEEDPAGEVDVRTWTFDGTFPFTTLLRSEARRSPDLAPYRTQLSALVQLLEPDSLHFGYRVADEILAFLYCAARLQDHDLPLEAAFDRALLQKLLPRLHGTRERLEAPLRRVVAFCTEAGAAEVDDTGASIAGRVHERLGELGPVSVSGLEQGVTLELRLGRTARKALTLLRALETEGFASAL
jgi:5-methylcytosine-specific restriction endonuclease McrBC GTP-binding regulatory subunit McrB